MTSHTDPRHEARKLALAYLFSTQFTTIAPEDIDLNLEIKGLTADETTQTIDFDQNLYNNLSSGVEAHLPEIDKLIEECAPEWPIEKIAKIDLTVLRIAIYEILYEDGIPAKVSIDQAVELAKLFGNDTSGKFVNGVLGTVVDKYASTKN